ncbi:unnamed protein product [Fraxinus pennsylvanica]|uniref:Uncharacterized protein n=1 Tax=Fraxinus pennsylvanica TaxID=56036 RepID=A0AAD2DUI7_9LAMI|nr:unnamed protein product [Fraxinus pennsylvanica]
MTSLNPAIVIAILSTRLGNYSMMSADELFYKGRFLPFKESSSQKTTTLRDELQNEEEEEGEEGVGFSLRPPRNFTRWRNGFLGLRKSHIGGPRNPQITVKVCRKRDWLSS